MGVFALLSMASVICIALVAARVTYSDSNRYISLVWNLFLAWIPFVIVGFELTILLGVLFTLAGMEIELTETLGREVDLRTAEDLSRYFRDKVVNLAEVIYERK